MNTYTYSEIEFETICGIVRNILRSDGTYIPLDPANSDYQRYLRWLENPDDEHIKVMANFEKMQAENLKIQEAVAAELQAEKDRQSKLLAEIEQAAKEMALKINTPEPPTEQTQEGEE
jgi:hypothetical protein